MAKIDSKNKGIQLKVKIRPTITIHMGKVRLGSIIFDDLGDAEKFMRRLSKSIKQIIEKLKKDKECVVKGERKLNEKHKKEEG